MDLKMYNAAKFGNLSDLKSEAKNNILTAFSTPQGNTILHIAARFGQARFAAEALEIEPQLLFKVNSKGDTPLHVAARYGDRALVEKFIGHYRMSSDPESNVGLRRSNAEGNTALHEAIVNEHGGLALELLRKDEGLALCDADAMESPLYLAAELGMVRVAEAILNLGRESFSIKGPNVKTPLHAAALRGQTETAQLLCAKVPDIIAHKDEFGRTALHYSVSTPARKISEVLLGKDRSLAYVPDNDGLTPLLVAVKLSHWSMVQLILKHCPDCGELQDSHGRNALHLIMAEGLRPNTVLNHADLKELLNGRDNDRNTPLHLAVKAGFIFGIKQLVRCENIDLRARNSNGFTALDLSENSWRSSTLQKYEHMKSLVSYGAIRGGKALGGKPVIPSAAPLAELKQLANTLLVVTTIICTIAFTAAFTLPGGYSSDPSDVGHAVLANRAAFQAFLFSDAVAVCSSSISGFLLIMGLVNYSYLRSALSYSIRLLTIALYATVVSFTTGIYSVMEKRCGWISIVITVLACGIPLWLKYNSYKFLSIEPATSDS